MAAEGRNTGAKKKNEAMNTKQVILVSSLGVLLAVGAAQAQPADGGPGPRPPRGPMLMHQGLLGLLDRYDINKDGQLDASEIASLKADIESGKIAPPPGERGRVAHRPLPPQILEQYDLNKDGKLDEAERAALQTDIQSGKLALPGGGGRPHRVPPTAQQVLEKFDVNKDGVLDATELEAFLSQPPPPPIHEPVPPPAAAPGE